MRLSMLNSNRKFSNQMKLVNANGICEFIAIVIKGELTRFRNDKFDKVYKPG